MNGDGASGPPPLLELDEEEIRRRFAEAGQAHVFRFWEDLDEDGRLRLLESARGIDLGRVADLSSGRALASPNPVPEPLGKEFVGRAHLLHEDRRRREAAAEAGIAMIARCKVAFVTVAGGQGTRLGFHRPKGLFPIGPGRKTLLDYHAEAVEAVSRIAGRPLPWVLLVSPPTLGETEDWLNTRGLPGIERASVRLACQETLPALDDDGRLLLAAADRIAVSPDGHGGTFRALRTSGALSWLLNLGVEEVSYFQVDNPLVPPGDALFLGLHSLAGGQMSSKVFPKLDPAEKVGVVARLNGRPGVIEYSELSPELAARRNPDGTLAFGHANMAAHVLSLPFMAAVAFRGLPVHRVRKVVPYLDAEGRRVVPAEPNAWKFETFLFDALAMAVRGVVMEVDRDEEFAPVKNAGGSDSPETARELLRKAGRWVE